MQFGSYKHGWGLQQWRDLAMTEIPAETGAEKFPLSWEKTILKPPET